MYKLCGNSLATMAMSLAVLASTIWTACAAVHRAPRQDLHDFLAPLRSDSSANAAAQADMATLSQATDRGMLAMAADAVRDTIEDSEMGSDLSVIQMMTKNTRITRTGRSEPATLGEYCNQPVAEASGPKEGERVMADWKDYGTMYPGTVHDKNRNGTYDIKYDDGWTEKRVDANDVQEIESKKKAAEKKGTKPKDDPACQLQDSLQGIKDGIKDVQDKIAQWSIGQRTKLMGASPSGAPPAQAPAAAPESAAQAAAVAEGSQAEELEKLKEMLAAKDAEAAELRRAVADNEVQIQNLENGGAAPAPAAPAAAPAVKTVDDLIAEYKAKIAARDDEIKELKQTLKKQAQRLASLGNSVVTLDDIDAAIAALSHQVALAEKKREELNEKGLLDPELRVGIDDITESMKLLYKKIAELKELKAKAKANRLLSEEKKRQALAAAEAAAKEAAEAKDAGDDKAAAKARAAQRQAELDAEEADALAKDAKAGDSKVLEVAGEMDADLKSVEKGAQTLDSGVHPHGAKWWRYRYERSYVEALLMCFITILMCFFSKLHQWFRQKLNERAVDPNHPIQEEDLMLMEETHGKIYLNWFETVALELMVCLNVFLCIWIAAKARLLHYFPIFMPSSDDFHLPHHGNEYKEIALDICIVLFFAVIFFYLLMFSVVHACFKMTMGLEDCAAASIDGGKFHQLLSSSQGGEKEYQAFESFFVTTVEAEMSSRSDEYKDVIEVLGSTDLKAFPTWKYWNLNIRGNARLMQTLGLRKWFLIAITFIGLALLHRYAHMGYVRIMMFFTVFTAVLVAVMYHYISHAVTNVQTGEMQQSNFSELHAKYSTEEWVLVVLGYVVYILCYGFSRMAFQRWMWELHFWPVLMMTMLALILAAVFCLFVAPVIPEFAMAMCMPPYMDPGNISQMHRIAKLMQKGTVSPMRQTPR